MSARHSRLSAADVCALLQGARCDLSSEAACQRDIEGLLASALPPERWAREHRLGPADRPDFLVDGVVIEVKARGARAADALRQIGRYAAYPEVEAVIVAYGGRALGLPAQIGGKPVFTVGLGRAWL
ncbi:MAG: hypothetical protein WDM92_16695 [Caulobacteraceae bacterium]